MTSIGFQVFPIVKRPSQRLMDQYRDVVTPYISDNMHRLHAGVASLRPYHKQSKLVGAALTVKTRPGDNLMFHKAIDMAQPGDVIVVESGGDTTNSLAGEIMKRLAQTRGIAGFVIDGAIRDSAAFAADTFPVYARGITHRGPYKDGPGEINVPVSLDGLIIHPGDIVVGDEDGLVAVPLDQAETILKLAQDQQASEEHIFQSIADGSVDRGWVDDTLRQKGCVVHDNV